MLSKADILKLKFDRIFNKHAVQDGTPPFETYSDSFDRADYGLAIRIEEGLADQTYNLELFIAIIATILLSAVLITGIAILINQRKIKKQLQELLDQKEDKPNGKEDCSN